MSKMARRQRKASQHEIEQKLRDAAYSNNLEEIENLFASKVNPNAQDEVCFSPPLVLF